MSAVLTLGSLFTRSILKTPSSYVSLHLSLSQIECQHLDLITGANLGKNAMLAFRILTSSGKIYLEYVVNKVKEELEKPETEGGGPEKVKSEIKLFPKEPFIPNSGGFQ